MITVKSSNLFSRPLHGLRFGSGPIPSDKSLGYFRPSAARTQYYGFWGKAHNLDTGIRLLEIHGGCRHAVVR